jgi:hypothetical protein
VYYWHEALSHFTVQMHEICSRFLAQIALKAYRDAFKRLESLPRYDQCNKRKKNSLSHYPEGMTGCPLQPSCPRPGAASESERPISAEFREAAEATHSWPWQSSREGTAMKRFTVCSWHHFQDLTATVSTDHAMCHVWAWPVQSAGILHSEVFAVPRGYRGVERRHAPRMTWLLRFTRTVLTYVSAVCGHHRSVFPGSLQVFFANQVFLFDISGTGLVRFVLCD